MTNIDISDAGTRTAAPEEPVESPVEGLSGSEGIAATPGSPAEVAEADVVATAGDAGSAESAEGTAESAEGTAESAAGSGEAAEAPAEKPKRKLPNRTRPRQLRFYLNEQEWALLDQLPFRGRAEFLRGVVTKALIERAETMAALGLDAPQDDRPKKSHGGRRKKTQPAQTGEGVSQAA
jgi:hypothetical protein